MDHSSASMKDTSEHFNEDIKSRCCKASQWEFLASVGSMLSSIGILLTKFTIQCYWNWSLVNSSLGSLFYGRGCLDTEKYVSGKSLLSIRNGEFIIRPALQLRSGSQGLDHLFLDFSNFFIGVYHLLQWILSYSGIDLSLLKVITMNYENSKSPITGTALFYIIFLKNLLLVGSMAPQQLWGIISLVVKVTSVVKV